MNYLEWMNAQKFAQVTDEGGVVSTNPVWKRETKYGSPKCKQNGAIVIRIERLEDETFCMSIDAKTDYMWVGLNAQGISEDRLIRHGRGLEQRLVAAWMEMSS